ncbi:hypothetical protein OnM2_022126 [Erysiphe neolycopersici]|uniref:Uncharacterized protein n=1 Tax=Erysiphe neolycopersici TaxID=212602 RepID=A0A420I2M0_9PEZI|nr:hypothetical protein OnM2_022126 [Erysiphe neolycopersici]
MLLRLLITFVVLTINVGNVFAVKGNSGDDQQIPPRNGISQHPTTEGSNNVRTGFSRLWPLNRNRKLKNSLEAIINSPYLLRGYIFKKAVCGNIHYRIQEVLVAAEAACEVMNNPQTLLTVKPYRYYPKDPDRFPENLRYYIYPLGRPLPTMSQSHYLSHRVLIDQNCKIRDLLTEKKKETFFKKFGKLFKGSQPKEYNQNYYDYIPCHVIPFKNHEINNK